jgi:hypothetical protein
VFVKLFSSILDETLHGVPETRGVFVDILLLADREGVVDMTAAAIAGRTGRKMEEVEKAIAILESPDPDSRSDVADGRRLVRLYDNRLWGWRVVNYLTYRGIRDEEDRRRQNRESQKRFRDRNQASSSVSQSKPSSAHAEAEAEAEAVNARSSSMTRERRGVNRKALENGVTLPEGEMTAIEVFDQIFWPEYPRKVAKIAARRAWERLKLKDTDDAEMAAIMGGLRRDIASEWKGRDQQTIPHAATWINQRRWEG